MDDEESLLCTAASEVPEIWFSEMRSSVLSRAAHKAVNGIVNRVFGSVRAVKEEHWALLEALFSAAATLIFASTDSCSAFSKAIYHLRFFVIFQNYFFIFPRANIIL